MTCIIVDDDKKEKARLKFLIEQFPDDLQIVGLASSVSEAITLVRSKDPDLVFLDIHLQDNNGFVFLDSFKEEFPFLVIFTTQDDQFALQAFQYYAQDYLLKPVKGDELSKAIQKVKNNRKENFKSDRFIILREAFDANKIDKIALATTDGFTFVKIDQIIHCEAHGNYTYVFLENGNSLLIAKTLKHYEAVLADKSFFRIHKSHLINLNCVRRFIKGKKSKVEMIDGKMLEVSTRRRVALLNQLDAIK